MYQSGRYLQRMSHLMLLCIVGQRVNMYRAIHLYSPDDKGNSLEITSQNQLGGCINDKFSIHDGAKTVIWVFAIAQRTDNEK
jgi:hypothetical protein